jgi:hypothetical protein
MKNLTVELSLSSKTIPRGLSTLSPTVSVAITGLLVLALTAPHITGYMSIATVNLFLLLIGFTLRHKNRRAHASLMTMGMLSDLILVLVLQFQRHAIQTAVAFKLSALNQAHILASTTATALYIPMAIIGISLLKQKAPNPKSPQQTMHRRMGWTVLILRTLGFFLMFSMLGHHPST